MGSRGAARLKDHATEAHILLMAKPGMMTEANIWE
jgi:hypothetical protein